VTCNHDEMRNVVPLAGFPRASAATIAGLILFLVSCTSSTNEPPPPLPEVGEEPSWPLPGAVQGIVGTWRDSDGKPVPSDRPLVMNVSQGAAHCGWGRLVFLVISWPLGFEVKGSAMSNPHIRLFVRLSTPEDLSASYFASPFDGNATLPRGARDTGYHRHGWHLWVKDSVIDRAVWLVHDDTVERWPASSDIILCA
jgi:hypothetical protein